MTAEHPFPVTPIRDLDWSGRCEMCRRTVVPEHEHTEAPRDPRHRVASTRAEQVTFLADAMWQALQIARYPGYGPARVQRMLHALEAGLVMAGLPKTREGLPIPENDLYGGDDEPTS